MHARTHGCVHAQNLPVEEYKQSDCYDNESNSYRQIHVVLMLANCEMQNVDI